MHSVTFADEHESQGIKDLRHSNILRLGPRSFVYLTQRAVQLVSGGVLFSVIRNSLALAGFFLHYWRMPKPFDVLALLSSATMMSRKAESYSPDTQVIDLAELRQIVWELQQKSEAVS